MGTISIKAYQDGSEAVIRVSDDGAGIDLRRLRQRAELLGVITPAQDLDQQEVLDLIFQPGISTSTVAGEVSGRGVGLDIVRTVIGRLKGSIEVSSERGVGTTFTLRLPVVLAVVQAMLVKEGEQSYAIPMAALERVVRSTAQPSTTLGRTPMIELDGEMFPYLELGLTLGQPSIRKPGEETSLLVIRAGDRRVALAVTDLLGQQEVVVKSLGHTSAQYAVFSAPQFLATERCCLS